MDRNAVTAKVIGDVTDMLVGYPFRARLDSEPPGEIAVVQMKDLGEEEVMDDNLFRIELNPAAHHYLDVYDVLFRARGLNHTAVLVSVNLGRAIAAAPLVRLRVKTSAQVLPAYLTWHINQPDSQAYLRSELKGTSVPMISTESLKRLPIDVPPLQVQAAITHIAVLGAAEQKLMEQVALLRKRNLERILWRCSQDSRTKVR